MYKIKSSEYDRELENTLFKILIKKFGKTESDEGLIDFLIAVTTSIPYIKSVTKLRIINEMHNHATKNKIKFISHSLLTHLLLIPTHHDNQLYDVIYYNRNIRYASMSINSSEFIDSERKQKYILTSHKIMNHNFRAHTLKDNIEFINDMQFIINDINQSSLSLYIIKQLKIYGMFFHIINNFKIDYIVALNKLALSIIENINATYTSEIFQEFLLFILVLSLEYLTKDPDFSNSHDMKSLMNNVLNISAIVKKLTLSTTRKLSTMDDVNYISDRDIKKSLNYLLNISNLSIWEFKYHLDKGLYNLILKTNNHNHKILMTQLLYKMTQKDYSSHLYRPANDIKIMYCYITHKMKNTKIEKIRTKLFDKLPLDGKTRIIKSTIRYYYHAYSSQKHLINSILSLMNHEINTILLNKHLITGGLLESTCKFESTSLLILLMTLIHNSIKYDINHSISTNGFINNFKMMIFKFLDFINLFPHELSSQDHRRLSPLNLFYQNYKADLASEVIMNKI